MFLTFTSVDILGIEKKYTWWFNTMEYALDVLSNLTDSGRCILSAKLIDNNNCIQLPLEAFDGYCMSGSIRELEMQWQFLLSEPVQSEFIA